MSSNIEETRRQMREMMAELRQYITLLDTANLSAATLLGYMARMGDENMRDAMITAQAFLLTLQTIQRVLTALEVQIGPVGWILIAAGVGISLGLGHEMQMRSAQY